MALWDLAAKQAGLPLHRLLGSRRDRVRAYASGLDFHLTDDEFERVLRTPPTHRLPRLQDQGRPPGFRARPAPAAAAERRCVPKRAGHDRCQRGVGRQGGAGEARGHPARRARSAVGRGSDPAQRLRRACACCASAAPWTQINSGEYLDAARQAPAARSRRRPTSSTSTARSPTSCASAGSPPNMGIPVSLGNTFLEVGVHMAVRAARGRMARIFVPELRPPRRAADGDPRRLRLCARPARPRAGAQRNGAPRLGDGRQCSIRAELGPAPANPRTRTIETDNH